MFVCQALLSEIMVSLSITLVQDFKIQNIVGSCDVQFPIRLEGLACAHGSFSKVNFLTAKISQDVVYIIITGTDIAFDYCQYEPEIFPGLVYRMKQPKVVLLVFTSGKIVITGAKVR